MLLESPGIRSQASRPGPQGLVIFQVFLHVVVIGAQFLLSSLGTLSSRRIQVRFSKG